MKLLIDAGNTRIKWALVDNGGGLLSGALPVEQADGLSQHFTEEFGAGLRGIQQIWVSNVASEEVAKHIRNACAAWQYTPHFIVAQAAQCGVRNSYTQPSQLGSDRWAALIAAWHLVRGACLVVNCGTATTIDVLSAQGEFTGGLILPGVELMQRSLNTATARLQLEQGTYAPFPLNTADAMISGAIQASCGAIERQHALLGDDSAPVILSGGAAAQLQAHLRRVTDETTSHLTNPAKDAGQVIGYGEASRLREKVRCGHSRTRELRSTVSWPPLRRVTDETTSHLTNPAKDAGQVIGYGEASRLQPQIQIVDNLVLQGLLLIAQETDT